MAVSIKWYGKALVNAFGGGTESESWSVDFLTNTIKITLHTSSYTPNQDTHDFFDDVTNELSTGSGYTSGGYTLLNKTLTYDTGTNTVKFDADDPSWTSSTLTARYAVIRKDSGVASTSPLLWYVDFGANASTSNETFLIQFASTGIATLVVS